jgi:hypothetical protein
MVYAALPRNDLDLGWSCGILFNTFLIRIDPTSSKLSEAKTCLRYWPDTV